MKIRTLAMVLAASLVSSGLAAQVSQRPDYLGRAIKDAVEQIRGGKNTNPLVALDKAIAQFEANELEVNKRIFCAQSAEESLLYMTIALEAGEDAVVVDRDYCQALYLRAYLQLDRKEYEEARRTLYRLHEMAPNNPQYAAELAYALRPTGDHDEMLKFYTVAYENAGVFGGDEGADRWRAVSLRGMGWVYADLKRWDEAEEKLRESLKIEPDHPIATGELDYIAQQRAKEED